MRFDGSRLLTPSQAYELGKNEGERAHRSQVRTRYDAPVCTLASLPDYQVQDYAMRACTWPGGFEMGAHDAYRRGYNDGIGRKIF